MLKYIGLIVTALALQGCMWQTVDSYDISRAVKFCGGMDKIAKITAHWSGGESVVCYDRGYEDLSKVTGATK